MLKLLGLFKRESVCTLLDTLQGKHAERYQHFRDLLKNNHGALNIMAEMEEAYYGGRVLTLYDIKAKYQQLSSAIDGIIRAMQGLSRKDFSRLSSIRESMNRSVHEELNCEPKFPSGDLVIPFESIDRESARMVGAKAGNLALAGNSLGLPTPKGFAVTANGFRWFVRENNLEEAIDAELSGLSPESLEGLEEVSARLKELIVQAGVPPDLARSILDAYAELEEKTHVGVAVAVRSSALGEDTEASFAGQYTTVLNVRRENLLEAYKTVLASKYSPHAITYRIQFGLEERETPMCVACIRMVESRASGVLYTVDPSRAYPNAMRLNAVMGLGEYLVSGKASPDVFLMDRESGTILEKALSRKEHRMVTRPEGGIVEEPLPEKEGLLPSIDETVARKLWEYGRRLEEYFGCPQDVEWALDQEAPPFILQSRPLHVTPVGASETEDEAFVDETEHPVILSGGKAASPGVAAGKVFLATEEGSLENLPEDAILVAKTASPAYARVMGKIRGIITDMGSTTSHLASVAREFGVAALMDTKIASTILHAEERITLDAVRMLVYRGEVEHLAAKARPSKRPIVESPLFQKMRRVLDHISPLHLTDPEGDNFKPEGCQSFHDIIRFTHEMAMREMFSYGDIADRVSSFRLKAKIPLFLQVIDLGGGLKFGLTTCDTLTPDHVESIPFRAIWKGFSHPGITWSGSVAFDAKNFMTLMASGAMAEVGGGTPGGTSYAMISQDYMNLSARFGYHFATVDALCGEDANQNYVTLQFSGGAGSFQGKSLRISFLGNVLQRLGFDVEMKGDLIDASLARHDRESMEERLDRMGRLLACTRLLDMAITGQHDVAYFTEAFFQGDYNFLERKREDTPQGVYIHTGDWNRIVEEDRVHCLQDGSKWGAHLSSGVAWAMGKTFGKSYQEFLDSVNAYFYFPLVIVKDWQMGNGVIRVRVKPVKGNIDRAGGIAFGLKDVCHYFAFRINALEDNAALFEYEDCKRVQRQMAEVRIASNEWYDLRVEVDGKFIRAYVNEQLVIDHETRSVPQGHVGLWTKADSVTVFGDLRVETGDTRRVISF